VRVDAHPDLRVGPVAAGIGDVEQHLARAGHRIGHVGHGELLGSARGVNDDGFHGFLPRTIPVVLQVRRQIKPPSKTAC
jgi:hypothetical protein